MVQCLAQHSWERASVSHQQMSVVWQTESQVTGGQSAAAGVRRIKQTPDHILPATR